MTDSGHFCVFRIVSVALVFFFFFKIPDFIHFTSFSVVGICEGTCVTTFKNPYNLQKSEGIPLSAVNALHYLPNF